MHVPAPPTPLMLYIGAGYDLSPLLTFAPHGPPYPIVPLTAQPKPNAPPPPRQHPTHDTYTSFLFVDAKPRHTSAFMVPDFDEWTSLDARVRNILHYAQGSLSRWRTLPSTPDLIWFEGGGDALHATQRAQDPDWHCASTSPQLPASTRSQPLTTLLYLFNTLDIELVRTPGLGDVLACVEALYVHGLRMHPRMGAGGGGGTGVSMLSPPHQLPSRPHPHACRGARHGAGAGGVHAGTHDLGWHQVEHDDDDVEGYALSALGVALKRCYVIPGSWGGPTGVKNVDFVRRARERAMGVGRSGQCARDVVSLKSVSASASSTAYSKGCGHALAVLEPTSPATRMHTLRMALSSTHKPVLKPVRGHGTAPYSAHIPHLPTPPSISPRTSSTPSTPALSRCTTPHHDRDTNSISASASSLSTSTSASASAASSTSSLRFSLPSPCSSVSSLPDGADGTEMTAQWPYTHPCPPSHTSLPPLPPHTPFHTSIPQIAYSPLLHEGQGAYYVQRTVAECVRLVGRGAGAEGGVSKGAGTGADMGGESGEEWEWDRERDGDVEGPRWSVWRRGGKARRVVGSVAASGDKRASKSVLVLESTSKSVSKSKATIRSTSNTSSKSKPTSASASKPTSKPASISKPKARRTSSSAP
ncbi:hypothetical protein K439DRAFT_1638007 [Ramaria rubella]|nr:hypothetical protein K439DRAFT_1638007 [Ramaria rubella]